MIEDTELLRRYVISGSEPAFAELVERRIGLVYSVALRQTQGDAHLAKDATQAVFTDLARKARTLAAQPVLAGWLCRAAHFAASDRMRAARRRIAREQEAHHMHELTSPEASDETWKATRPLLDRLLGEMDERDRDALVLRFFDGRPFAEIGAQLRMSENAARMRVERALDKLRLALARQGVKSTGAALSVALANHVGAAVPVGLAASVTSGALAGGAWAGGGVGSMLAAAQVPFAAAVVIVAAGAMWWTGEHRMQTALRQEIAVQRTRSETMARLQKENEMLARVADEVGELRTIKPQLVRLNAEAQVLERRLAAKTTAGGAATLSGGPPLVPLTVPAGNELVSLSLPDADHETVLRALEIYLQRKIVHDPSIARNRRLVRLRTDRPTPKPEVIEMVRVALRDSAGIILEPMADGRLLAKAWGGP